PRSGRLAEPLSRPGWPTRTSTRPDGSGGPSPISEREYERAPTDKSPWNGSYERRDRRRAGAGSHDRYHDDRPTESAAAPDRDRVPQHRRQDLHQRHALEKSEELAGQPRGRSTHDVSSQGQGDGRPAGDRSHHRPGGGAARGLAARGAQLGPDRPRGDGALQPADRGHPGPEVGPPAPATRTAEVKRAEF